MVSLTKLGPFCNGRTNVTVRQSKSLEDQEIGIQFALLWKVLTDKLEVLFPGGDDTDTSIVPALDVRSQVLSIEDRRKLLHLETNSCFILLLLIFMFLAFLMMCCNRSSLNPVIWPRIARPMCDGRPFASSLFRRLAGRGPFFRRFPFLQFALSLAC